MLETYAWWAYCRKLLMGRREEDQQYLESFEAGILDDARVSSRPNRGANRRGRLTNLSRSFTVYCKIPCDHMATEQLILPGIEMGFKFGQEDNEKRLNCWDTLTVAAGKYD